MSAFAAGRVSELAGCGASASDTARPRREQLSEMKGAERFAGNRSVVPVWRTDNRVVDA